MVANRGLHLLCMLLTEAMITFCGGIPAYFQAAMVSKPYFMEVIVAIRGILTVTSCTRHYRIIGCSHAVEGTPLTTLAATCCVTDP
jgi:hypothetical protein